MSTCDNEKCKKNIDDIKQFKAGGLEFCSQECLDETVDELVNDSNSLNNLKMRIRQIIRLFKICKGFESKCRKV